MSQKSGKTGFTGKRREMGIEPRKQKLFGIQFLTTRCIFEFVFRHIMPEDIFRHIMPEDIFRHIMPEDIFRHIMPEDQYTNIQIFKYTNIQICDMTMTMKYHFG